MALRIPHLANGPTHWLQCRDYTSFFSSKTACTLDFSYKVHSINTPGQIYAIQAAVNSMFAFWPYGNNAIATSFSGVSGAGIQSGLREGLWHRITYTAETNGGYFKTYVDGNRVDAQPFSAATTLTDVNTLMWLGPQYATDGDTYEHDFSIDQFNGWNDRALTEAEVNSLAQGITHPSDYGVPANRFRYDFTQQAPLTPTVVNGPGAGGGDSGLYDLDGTTLGFWVTHGSPLWDNDAYVFTNNCVLRTPVICTSGRTIEFTAETALGVPMLLYYNPGQNPSTPAVSLNGGPTVYLSHDTTATSNRPLYITDAVDQLVTNWKLPWKVTPSDVVQVTIPAGVFKGTNGAPNIGISFTAQNNAEILRENFDGVIRSDHPRIGVCSSGLGDFSTEMYYSNMLKNGTLWREFGGNGFERYIYDSLGNITGITGGVGTGKAHIPLLGGGGSTEGIHTLLYKAGDPFLTERGGFTEGSANITLISGPTTVGGMTRKQYHVNDNTSLTVITNIPTDSIQLLDPYSVDSTGYASVGLIHPKWLQHYSVGRLNIYRSLTAVNTSAALFDDFGADGWYSPFDGYIHTTPVTSMTRVAGTVGVEIPLAFENQYLYCYHCVTPAPHKFVECQPVVFQGTGGTRDNEQHYSLTGSPTGGTYTITSPLSTGSVTTTPIAWNADAPTVQAALQVACGDDPVTGRTRINVSFYAPSSTFIVYYLGPLSHSIGNMSVNVSGLTGGTPGATTSNVGGGGGIDGAPGSGIVVDSSTSFYWNSNTPAAPGTPSPSYKATVVNSSFNLADPLSILSGLYPLDRVIGLCNACNLDYYFTYPACFPDAEAAKHEQYVALHLNLGLKCIREYANEAWNIGSTVFGYCQQQGHAAGFGALSDPGAAFYGQRAAQIIKAGRDAWVAAGRDTNDFIGIMCWQVVSAGNARDICLAHADAWWSAQGFTGKPFDYIGYAPYNGSEICPGGFNQRYADYMLGGPAGTIDPEAVIDVMELGVEGPWVQGRMKQYYDTFHSLGYRFGFYEWGNDPGTSNNTVESGMPQENYPNGNTLINSALVAAQNHIRNSNTLIRTMNLAAQYDCDFACYLVSIAGGGRYGAEQQRCTMYQADGDGTGNIGHLFDTLPPPPEANNAFALAAIALTPSSSTPTLAVIPISAVISTTSTITFTGTNTLWMSATPATLFSISALAGCSLGTPTVLTDTSATAVLTLGATPGSITFTDSTTSATSNFIVTSSLPTTTAAPTTTTTAHPTTTTTAHPTTTTTAHPTTTTTAPSLPLPPQLSSSPHSVKYPIRLYPSLVQSPDRVVTGWNPMPVQYWLQSRAGRVTSDFIVVDPRVPNQLSLDIEDLPSLPPFPPPPPPATTTTTSRPTTTTSHAPTTTTTAAPTTTTSHAPTTTSTTTSTTTTSTTTSTTTTSTTTPPTTTTTTAPPGPPPPPGSVWSLDYPIGLLFLTDPNINAVSSITGIQCTDGQTCSLLQDQATGNHPLDPLGAGAAQPTFIANDIAGQGVLQWDTTIQNYLGNTSFNISGLAGMTGFSLTKFNDIALTQVVFGWQAAGSIGAFLFYLDSGVIKFSVNNTIVVGHAADTAYHLISWRYNSATNLIDSKIDHANDLVGATGPGGNVPNSVNGLVLGYWPGSPLVLHARLGLQAMYGVALSDADWALTHNTFLAKYSL